MFHKVLRAAYGATSKLLEVQLRGAGDSADDDDAEPDDRVPFLQQLGLAVRPLIASPRASTLQAWVDPDGGETHAKALWDKARTPTDLAEGETRLYAAGAIAHVMKLLVDKIIVEAARIDLGAGATKKVNREGDAIQPGTLGIVATGTTITFTYTAPGGSAQVVTVTVPMGVAQAGNASITLGGKTGPGSSTVFAKD